MSLQAYTKSLLDPFDKGMSQPKLLDGKVSRSSGIRLRATGEITCNQSGSTYIALIPGSSNVLTWRVDSDPLVPEIAPTPFQGHLDTATDRGNVKAVRIVGTALRLSLVNSADQNEGYWEAARIPTCALDFGFHEPDPVGAPGVYTTAVTQALGNLDLSNYQTYLTGKLRDIHRYQFKLNAIDNDINFQRCVTEPPQVDQFVSEQWDTIIIKVHGRVEIGAPSMMMYDCISAQEVIYKENTALARLMTTSPYVPQTKSLLTRTRFNPPLESRSVNATKNRMSNSVQSFAERTLEIIQNDSSMFSGNDEEWEKYTLLMRLVSSIVQADPEDVSESDLGDIVCKLNELYDLETVISVSVVEPTEEDDQDPPSDQDVRADESVTSLTTLESD